MKSRDFEGLTAYLGLTRSQIDQRIRLLRYAGMIPSGGRGPHAPELEPLHVALILLQFASPTATSAMEHGLRAGSLRMVAPPGCAHLLGRPAETELSLAAALVVLLVEVGQHTWRRLIVDAEGRRATLTIIRDGRPLDVHFVPEPEKFSEFVGRDPARYEAFGSSQAAASLTVGAAFIEQMGLRLRGATDAFAGLSMQERASALAEIARAERELESVLAGAGPGRHV